MITTPQLIERFGKPTQDGRAYLVTIKLPFPMRLAWDKNTVINKMRCHRFIANQFTAIFNEILAVYGLKRIQELGIDLYGGCFNFRAMRGGSDYSRHSWGVAIDLDPERNQLKTPFNKSNFSKADYLQLHAIFEEYGFENLGKVKGYDAMHWQIKG